MEDEQPGALRRHPQRANCRYGSQEPSQQVRDSSVRCRLDRASVLAVFRFEVTRLTNASTSVICGSRLLMKP